MRIIRKETTVSTNADAHAGRPGDVFAAEFQTGGRGRLGHRWEAPAGLNLTFSAVLDDCGRSPAEVSTLPLVAGLAVAKAAEAIIRAVSRSAPRHPLGIKWPNDVLAGGRKLCGILCERGEGTVIAGIGINVNQTEFPPELADRATSLALETGCPFDRDGAFEAFLDSLFSLHRRWAESGFAALHRELAAYDILAGRTVAVRQTDSDAFPAEGLCGGIQPDGTLIVAGEKIHAGEAHVLSRR